MNTILVDTKDSLTLVEGKEGMTRSICGESCTDLFVVLVGLGRDCSWGTPSPVRQGIWSLN